ncbi:MAG: LysR family transcriptional regulator [Treponema sp.]|nr:LysR family transcriptional regulator [Treponema sp.]
MTLRHFRIFLAVCELESMTAAAERLGMTQPPVSQSIAELERHYGVRLFERLGRRIKVSSEGEVLRSYAAETLRLVDEAERGLFDLQDSGSLRVGASMTVGTALLPRILEELKARMPRLRLYLAVDNTAAIVAKLQAAELDIGFVEGMGERPEVLAEALYEDELALICSPRHELAAASRLRPEDLAGRGFVVREEGSGTREAFAEALSAAGIGWAETGVANSAEAIIELASRGLGLAFISRLLVREAVAAGKLVALRVEGLAVKRKFRIVRRRNKRLTETMAAFVEGCRACIANMPP